MWNVTICDDDRGILDQLCAYLKRLEELTGEHFQTTCLTSGEKLLTQLPPDTDILLLDIQMRPISGLEAARDLRKRDRHLCVIFVTSQVQYALDCYDVHAFGFLRKPIQFGQFRQQMTDAMELLAARQGVMIVLKAGGELHRYNCNDIYYMEARRHTIVVALQHETCEYGASLRELEKKLQGHGFFRCHKSILVNLRKIKKIGQTELVMLNGDTIPLSRHRRQEFLVAFSQQAGGEL